MIIAAIASGTIVLTAIAIFALGLFEGVAINERTFPNAIIREAVVEQLDSDDDGRLAVEETDRVTGLIYTDRGAKFVLNGDLATVERERSAVPRSFQGTPPATLDGLQHFPHLSALIASSAQLDAVDTASIPALRYVDLRGNHITELDLSRNARLESLLCDSTVKTEGLDDADLYFTELMTEYSIGDGADAETMEYDLQGRLTKRTNGLLTYEFSYDDANRLSHMKVAQPAFPPAEMPFTYDANGNLSSWVRDESPIIGIDPDPKTYRFGYDANGSLAQLTMAHELPPTRESGTFAYADSGTDIAYHDTLTSSVGDEDVDVLFSRDTKGRVERFQLSVDYSEGTQARCEGAYGYAGSGELLYSSIALTGSNGVAQEGSLRNTYDATGAPEQMVAGYASSSSTAVFSCDEDGYPYQVEERITDSSPLATVRMAYVKFVGSFSTRESRRFLPSVRYQSNLPLFRLQNQTPWEALMPLGGMYGDYTPFSLVVEGPECALGRALGLIPMTLTNANETRLADYDREHWAEWSKGSADATFVEDDEAEDIQAQEPAQETPPSLPMSPEQFLNDSVYGSVVRQYVELAQQVNASENGVTPDDVHRAEQSDSLVSADFLTALMDLTEPIAFEFSAVDLNGDGRYQLVVREASLSGDSDEIGAIYGDEGGRGALALASAYRTHCRVTSNGRVWRLTTAGAEYNYYDVYRIDGGKAEKVASLSMELSDSRTPGGQPMTDVQLTYEDGQSGSAVMTQTEAHETYEEFFRLYPPLPIQWTRITSL